MTGVISISFGTTFKGSGTSIACENGVVTVIGSEMTIERDGLEEKKSYPDMGNGVKQEVQAWGEAIVSGKPNAAQTPEEALKDLQLVSYR